MALPLAVEAALAPDEVRRARHLVGPADVEVVGDDLVEEDPSRDRLAGHLGEGELRLQDGHLVGVARRDVVLGEGVRQDPQPLAQQGIDVTGAQGGADRLQRGRVVAGGEAVVQGLKADAGLGGLPLGPVVAVDALRIRPDYVPMVWSFRD
jgi:hypothetical protein